MRNRPENVAGRVFDPPGFAGPDHATRASGLPGLGNGLSPPKSKDASFHHGRHKWLPMVAGDRMLTRSALAVAVMIWDYMNVKTGTAWPSMQTMAERLNINRSSVLRAVALLEQRGWITIEHGHRKRSNRYRPCFGLPEVKKRVGADVPLG